MLIDRMQKQRLLVLALAVLGCFLVRYARAAGENVIINEFMSKNNGILLDAAAKTPDWIEIKNEEASDVDLKGWTVALGEAEGDKNWVFPAAVVPANGYLMLYASGDDLFNQSAKELHTNFELKSPETIILSRADGSQASTVGLDGKIPSQISNVSFGIPTASPSGAARYKYLQQPTPGAENSEALATQGPLITELTQAVTPEPIAGEDIVIDATVEETLHAVDEVKLVYRVNFEPDQAVAMTKGSGNSFTATIPATIFQAGDMVRWYVEAVDSSAISTRSPNATTPKDSFYYGTVISPSTNSTLPILYWFTQDIEKSSTVDGANGSMYYQGQFVDNIFVDRRGVTSLNYKKPKLSFKLPSKSVRLQDGAPEVNEFGLQSSYYELGENSYMKETVALQVMRESGVPAPLSFHIIVQANSKFWGLFSIVEIIDNEFLERNDLPSSGPLFKSLSGELSNLRWDLPIAEMPNYYKKENRKKQDDDWYLLNNFTWGIAGGGPLSRSNYVMDALNVPEVINEAAVQTLLNNLDRCTKNFFVYFDDKTDQWYKFPWDLEASMGQDNNLGGKPGHVYCVLACEQWNSPLYCDSEHPQDMVKETPWGTVTVNPEDYILGKQPTQVGRKLFQASNALQFPASDGWDNPDRNTTAEASKNGAPGTYNHLTDAILDVEKTRVMFFRRLRTLSDTYYANGKLQQIIEQQYSAIKDLALQDNAIWGGGNITRGFLLLTTEFIPTRQAQLLNLYGPQGQRPLLPAAQANNTNVVVGTVETAPANASWHYVALTNQEAGAVDVSLWELSVGDKSYQIPAGSVIPASESMFLTPSVKGFRSRSSSPKGGEGLLVVELKDFAIPKDGKFALKQTPSP